MSVLRDHYQTADSVTMDNSQAAITVFSIVELLEDILLNLPLRDLDLAQLISKTVYNCVNNSMKIKQALFLAPATETRLIFNDDPRTLFGRTWMTVDGWRGRFRPLLNPFFRFEEYRRLSPSWTAIETHNLPPTMLLTHPPITLLSAVEWDYLRAGIDTPKPWGWPRHTVPEEIDNPCGIRYGDYTEVLAQLEKSKRAISQETCRSYGTPEREDRMDRFVVIRGSREWERVRKESVDTVTGYEMLRLMGMPNEEMLTTLEALEERYPEVEEEHALKAVQRMFAIETEAA